MDKINYKQGKGWKAISTSTSLENIELVKKYNISWARALEIGLAIIFNEIDAKKHPLPQNLIKYKNKLTKS